MEKPKRETADVLTFNLVSMHKSLSIVWNYKPLDLSLNLNQTEMRLLDNKLHVLCRYISI